jgi:hypothetical protein
MSTPASARASRTTPRKIPYSITIDGARDVVLTGDFTGWSKTGVKLTRGDGSEWHATLELLPGRYEYRILVDGAWSDYPKEAKRVSNRLGGTNCVLVVA